MKFDAHAAKSLPPGEHLNVEGCPGLRLVVTASRRSWSFRYRSPIDGLMRQVKIGEWPAMPVAAAAGAWSKLRDAVANGEDPSKKRSEARAAAPKVASAPQGAQTVRAVCDAYLTGHIEANRKEKGAREVARMFSQMIPATFASKDAATLTRGDAFSLIESHASIPTQAGNLKRELAAAWDHALDADRLPGATPNHWRSIMRGKLKSTGKTIAGEKIGTAKRVLSAAELGELIVWLPNFSRLVEDALTLYLWTGCRGAEIMAMMGSEVADTPDGLVWTIPKQKTKNARHAGAMDQRVPLIGRAALIVRRRIAAHGKGYLFPSDTGPGHTQQKMVSESVYFRQPYCKIREKWARTRLTVTHWGPHDLRRSSRTLLAALGCPHDVGESIIGHMVSGVAGVYMLYKFDPEKMEWLTRLDAELERLAAAHVKAASAKQG